MNSIPTLAALHRQRSEGLLATTFGPRGLIRHREESCLKLRLPRGVPDAILINTSGGLAGGDRLATHLSVVPGALAQVTSQAAERVYQTLGPPATIAHEFEIGSGAGLHWLPLETILFNGASLHRKLEVRLAQEARLLAAEAVVLGRGAMGETLSDFTFAEEWNIWREGKLIHAERMKLGPQLPAQAAALGKNRAFATVLLAAPEAEAAAAQIRARAETGVGVSSWNGKLVARLVATDGFLLRKQLKTVLSACLQGRALPRTWEM